MGAILLEMKRIQIPGTGSRDRFLNIRQNGHTVSRPKEGTWQIIKFSEAPLFFVSKNGNSLR